MDAWLFPFLFHSSAAAELSPPPTLQQGSSQSKSLSSLCPSHRQTNPGLLVHPADFSFSSPTPNSGPGCHYLRMFTFRRCRLGSRPPLAPEGLGTSSPLLAGAKCGCHWLRGPGALVLENVQPGGGRERGAGTQAPGSAVTLLSAQQKLARKGLWLHGSSQHSHSFKGQRLINLFSHKFIVNL